MNTASKAMLLVLFVITNISAFAADGINDDTTSRWKAVSALPEFWIGLAVFIAIIGLAVFSGKNKNEHAV